MNYDWLYERSGYWTRIKIERGTIEFSLGRNHYSGEIVGAAMFAAIFAGILMVPTGNQFWFFPIFMGLLPFTLYSGFKRIRQRYSHFPIVFSAQASDKDDCNEIPFSNVERLLIRENTGRESDDTALAQLYAVLKHADSPLLLHQHYLFRKQLVLETAIKISSELDVPIDNET